MFPDAHGLDKMYQAEGPDFDCSLTPGGDSEGPKTLLSEINRLAKLPLLFTPGSKWQYGFSTDVLGCIVEIVSGMRLDRFCEENILRPLKMLDTDFWVPPARVPKFATCYRFISPEDPLHKLDDGSTYFAEPRERGTILPRSNPHINQINRHL